MLSTYADMSKSLFHTIVRSLLLKFFLEQALTLSLLTDPHRRTTVTDSDKQLEQRKDVYT